MKKKSYLLGSGICLIIMGVSFILFINNPWIETPIFRGIEYSRKYPVLVLLLSSLVALITLIWIQIRYSKRKSS